MEKPILECLYMAEYASSKTGDSKKISTTSPWVPVGYIRNTWWPEKKPGKQKPSRKAIKHVLQSLKTRGLARKKRFSESYCITEKGMKQYATHFQ